MRLCAACGGEVEPLQGPGRPKMYCSKDCARGRNTTRTCLVCGADFPNRKGGPRFCSEDCRATFGKAERRQCSVEGCERIEDERKGLCGMHYRRKRLTGDVGPAESTRGGTCTVELCSRPHSSNGLCALHYNRLRTTGEVGPSGLKERPSGTVWTDPQTGYVYVGKRLQHRVVMEELIGRPLTSDESVHHRNGNRADNRIENLEIWSRYQPAGQRVEDKLKWAREIVAQYGDLPPELLG